MLRKFYPREYMDSAYAIDFEKKREEGYRGVIFDIDNTLVPHGAPADDRARKLALRLKELGFRVLLLSNNKEERVTMFNKDFGALYIHKAGKPGVKNYRRAMELLGTDRENTLFVGDQLFTDIWGANRAGMETILVKPMDKREEIQIVLKRFLEKPVLYFYKRSLRRMKGNE